jgi:hypothetical protein
MTRYRDLERNVETPPIPEPTSKMSPPSGNAFITTWATAEFLIHTSAASGNAIASRSPNREGDGGKILGMTI